MTYKTEFADFDFEVPAELTAEWGFTDESWHNDMSPSFRRGRYVLWIDYTNPEAREFPVSPQFAIYRETDDGDMGESLLECDKWEAVQNFIRDAIEFGVIS